MDILSEMATRAQHRHNLFKVSFYLQKGSNNFIQSLCQGVLVVLSGGIDGRMALYIFRVYKRKG